jgi:pimeloyl-ACP methyl ester carboxylesterase
MAQRYNVRLTQLVSSVILVVLFGGYGSAKSVLDRFITVDDLRVHYIEVGNGPTIVMIHGNAGSVADFNFGAVDLLSSCYRVVAVDRPGHGRSDRGSTKASVEVQAELLHHVLSSLGIDKPSLVGHSWGAALALAYALKYPHEVSGLVLLAPAAYPDETGNNLLAAIARTPVIGDLSVAIGKTVLGRRLLERGLAMAFFPERVPDPYLKLAYSLWLSRKRVKAYVEDESSLNFSLNKMSKHYAEIRIPVVIVTGDRDQIVSPAQNAYTLHATLPQSQLIEIKDTGHEIPLTHPESIATALNLISLQN